MLILSFRHAPPGTPLFNVSGLPLAVRGTLDGIKNGYGQLCLLVHDADKLHVIQALQQYSHLRKINVASSKKEFLHGLQGETHLTESHEITLVAGNNVWAGSFLASLKSSSGPNTSMIGRYPQNPGMIQRMKQEDIKNFAAALFTDSQAGLLPASGGRSSHNSQWYTIHTQNDISAAEDFLLSQLVKKADGIISRNINRKISLAITRRLMRTTVTPNQITAGVLLIGILSGPAILYWGGYGGLVTGALLYYLAAILDGCDGELSRLKYLGSPTGAWLDTVVDDMVGLSYILGLYWHLTAQTAAWIWAGCAAVFFYLLTLGPRYYIMAVFLNSGDYQQLSALKPRAAASTMITRTLHIMEDTVCRTDFIPFAAFVTAIINIPALFAGAFLFGTVASASDSLHTLYSMTRLFPRQSEKEVTENGIDDRNGKP